jgi:hypothetical protein
VRTLVLDVTARDRNLRSSLVFRPAKTMARYCGKIVRALPLHDAICPGEVLGQPCTVLLSRQLDMGRGEKQIKINIVSAGCSSYIYISLSLWCLWKEKVLVACAWLCLHIGKNAAADLLCPFWSHHI